MAYGLHCVVVLYSSHSLLIEENERCEQLKCHTDKNVQNLRHFDSLPLRNKIRLRTFPASWKNMILTNIFNNFLNLAKQLLNSFLTAFHHVQNATIPIFLFSFVRPEPSNMKHELPLLFKKKIWTVCSLQVSMIRNWPGIVKAHVESLLTNPNTRK